MDTYKIDEVARTAYRKGKSAAEKAFREYLVRAAFRDSNLDQLYREVLFAATEFGERVPRRTRYLIKKEILEERFENIYGCHPLPSLPPEVEENLIYIALLFAAPRALVKCASKALLKYIREGGTNAAAFAEALYYFIQKVWRAADETGEHLPLTREELFKSFEKTMKRARNFEVLMNLRSRF